ncbi:hypothetical protein LTR70_003115 [Exophiala xenobiotica]|uniref:Wax synthase domain-containing protein n=1 Tax=Lithohypha guttulata TaxID=1690604 RepID=A0ABR0KH48_9EURO|nr:hypothetical protein LTR24_002652 [Lithohypha guttulata]KAK5323826.1 hypothetical protein LTR70_003115 [Exophiala xenobiotica]
MRELLKSLASQFYEHFTVTQPRPSLHPIPGTKPLTPAAAICPTLLYYIALLFLPPAPPPGVGPRLAKLLRYTLALVAGILFFRLPLAYHVPRSIGLTYQLGLVGIYGGLRVLDAFFISAWWFGRVPKRVTYFHYARSETPTPDHGNGDVLQQREWTDGGVKDPYHHSERANLRKTKSRGSSPVPAQKRGSGSKIVGMNGRSNGAVNPSAPGATSTPINTPALSSGRNTRRQSTTAETASYFFSKTLAGPKPIPVYETAKTDEDYPCTFLDRASWALELELSMRGQGFTWTTADVRHTRKTWLPTIGNRIHSVAMHVLPVQLGAWYIISTVYTKYLASTLEKDDYNPFATATRASVAYKFTRQGELFDSLPIPIQLLLTVALGAFLMSAFSLGHSIFAVMLHPFSPHPLAFFPPLYTTRVWSLTSVRKFWSFGWHRLFARLFLVWGVWPGEWLERKLLGKRANQPADVGKVIGAFGSSALVHAFSVRGVLAGRWSDAAGEMRFFLLNGAAVVAEGVVQRLVKNGRRKLGWSEKMWYDAWIGRMWWIGAVVWSGREFARGWVKSGLVREMAFR